MRKTQRYANKREVKPRLSPDYLLLIWIRIAGWETANAATNGAKILSVPDKLVREKSESEAA